MTPRTILHVGPHKTGSTALQVAFHENERALDAAGLRYPRAGRVGHGHFAMVNWARGRPAPFEPADLAREAEGAPSVLISCENAVHLTDEELARLRDALPADRPVRVVYYLRRLVDLWRSHWQELVKHGLPLSMLDYVAFATAVNAPRTMRIDQTAQMAALEDVFGEGNVTVVGYDALREAGRDIVGHFLSDIAGLDAPSLRGRTVNEAEPAWRMELVRLLNRIHRETTRRTATQELRLAAFAMLARDEVPFADRFRALVAERSRPLVIASDGAAQAAQARFVRRFGDRIAGEREAIVAAYTAPVTRRVDGFEFPFVAERALLDEAVALYHALPEEARASVGPVQ